MKYPTKSQLIAALSRAGELHHTYKKEHLGGSRDEHWSGFYAAYMIGRYDLFQNIEALTEELEKVPVIANWAQEAAETLLDLSEKEGSTAERQGQNEILYVCPHCFTAAEAPGKCAVCGYQLHEFKPGDVDDPCRCPVINERGEVVTHAPLWWLRSVAPELAERMEKDRNKNESH